MKNKLVYIFLSFTIINLFCEEGIPSIQLPKIELEIEDKKELLSDIIVQDIALPDIMPDTIDKPEFTDMIKIDLESTLPEETDITDKNDPVDAVILFGYGLNNNILADFSIFVKGINPQISIRYLREAREGLKIDKPEEKNASSLDDLKAELLYSYKKFSLGSELGYFEKSYDLQDNSIYRNWRKRSLNIDIGPSLKFNNQNDLTLRVFNSFLFSLGSGKDDSATSRNDFAYLLQSDIVYSQVFANNHFITTHLGYDYNYIETKINSSTTELPSNYKNRYFNNIKAGLNYSTMIKEAFLIKASTEFLGSFRDKEFFWYIIPNIKFGYNLFDYFHCYVEGGATLVEKPNQYWYKIFDFTVFPRDITPGYRWYCKTGLKGTVTGWFSGYSDVEFAYNKDGVDWFFTATENLYSLQKRDFMEVNLVAGFTFNFKQYLEITTEWKHFFIDRSYFSARDSINATIKWGAPKIGLDFNLSFNAQIFRTDTQNNIMGNIYLLNGGIDWNWKEKFGVGIIFNNILYFQQYQLMAGYDEAGFEFIIYMKVGF